jgi:hypothetical protein
MRVRRRLGRRRCEADAVLPAVPEDRLLARGDAVKPVEAVASEPKTVAAVAEWS